ncbi:MAG: hypothetical protein PHG66_05805 [Candidatus Colwellbacteria bacterium]|nr:hypothetical protein [Candidatus Colwellbacteria bacterium]
MQPYERLARILRADKDTVRILDERMAAATGKKGVLDEIVADNDRLIDDRLGVMGFTRGVGAKQVYDGLISKIEADDQKLSEILGHPSSSDAKCCAEVLEKAKTVANPPFGFFMKLGKAEEFLKKEPPKNVMAALGYSSVEAMLSHEDIFEVYASLRFIEGADWLNGVFFKQYEALEPSDFEFREIQSRALGERWVKMSEGFVKKKYHNLSHLKELGLIFALPVTLGIPGELLRGFSLMLHYYNEIVFYSYLFAKYAEKEPEVFSRNLISLLRGDAIDHRVPVSEKANWLVIPRYFAKDDENDWRLFEPRINPEAMHWEKAERGLNTLPADLSFWSGLNWVGDDFKSDAGIDVLVSFNLVDTVMSLVKEKEMVKYLYHHQESLWNRIYSGYLGEAEMEKAMKDHLIEGWFSI